MSPDPASGPTGSRPAPRGLAPASLAALVVAWMAPACGGETASVDVAVRDSAGLTIVENPAGAVEAAPRWEVASEPELDVGTMDGEPAYQFSQVLDAVTLSDGTVVIAHNEPPELRFYDPDGTHLRTAGGEGEGPGEFQSVRWLTRLPGDTLLVHDWRLIRVSRFSPGGTFLESVQLAMDVPVATLAGRTSDGTMVVEPPGVFGGGSMPSEGTQRQDVPLLAVGSDGAVRDTIALRRGEQFYVSRSGGGFMARTVPFSTAPHEAVAADAVYTANSSSWEIRELSAEGGVRRIVRLDRERPPLTEAEWDETVERRIGGSDGPADREQQEEMYADMPVPDRHPAFDAMELDATGHLWVREAGAEDASDGGEADRWLVFSPDGRLRAVAHTASRFRPLDIGRDRLVGRWVDELGVHHLRAYRLERDGPEGGG